MTLTPVNQGPGMGTVDEQYAMWATQKAERLRLQDELSTVRPVEHFAYFKRKGQALAAADALVDLGFNVTTGRARLRTMICATRSEALTDESVQLFLGEVVTTVESHGGDYDGWGASTAA